jgi:hypothetical protein
MYIAVTITCNKKKNYGEDITHIEEALKFITTKNAIHLTGVYEVQKKGRHLLHYHGTCMNVDVKNKKLPYFPQGIQKKLNVSVRIKKVTGLEGWIKYQNKETIGPIWAYNQLNTYMFDTQDLFTNSTDLSNIQLDLKSP